jgi:hypothetical protein
VLHIRQRFLITVAIRFLDVKLFEGTSKICLSIIAMLLRCGEGTRNVVERRELRIDRRNLRHTIWGALRKAGCSRRWSAIKLASKLAARRNGLFLDRSWGDRQCSRILARSCSAYFCGG